jgi:hypothetical protein
MCPVKWPLPAAADDDLGQRSRSGDLAPLVAQRLDAVGQGRDGGSVGETMTSSGK